MIYAINSLPLLLPCILYVHKHIRTQYTYTDSEYSIIYVFNKQNISNISGNWQL